MEKYQAKITTEAIKNIILPKFDNFMKELRDSKEVQKEVAEEIKKIEALEDVLSNAELDVHLNEDSYLEIWMNGYSFSYHKDSGLVKVSGGAKNNAERRIYEKHNFYSDWIKGGLLNTRIEAIVSLLDPMAFEDILTVVESQIDFKEFINN